MWDFFCSFLLVSDITFLVYHTLFNMYNIFIPAFPHLNKRKPVPKELYISSLTRAFCIICSGDHFQQPIGNSPSQPQLPIAVDTRENLLLSGHGKPAGQIAPLADFSNSLLLQQIPHTLNRLLQGAFSVEKMALHIL